MAYMQIPPRPSEEHVKILVVGERGVGKTTLLQNLLVSYGGARVFEQVGTSTKVMVGSQLSACDAHSTGAPQRCLFRRLADSTQHTVG